MKDKTFVRVGCLQVGFSYYLRMHADKQDRALFTRVKFIDITNCPAVVVVQDNRKNLIQCNRSDLYIPAVAGAV